MPRPPIAVVGLSALFPGSPDLDAFWRNIVAGRDLITDVPASHWKIDDYFAADPKAPDRTYCRRGAFLPSVDFDPLAFGIPPASLPATDTSQLLALLAAQRVLEDAETGSLRPLDRKRTSVVLGVTGTTELTAHMSARMARPHWAQGLREAGVSEDRIEELCERIAAQFVPWQESTFPGLLGNVVAGRIANRLDLGGTNCVVDAACASSLAALHHGLLELWQGESDTVLVGGVDTLNDPLMYLCFSKTPALSASGDCRPFSDQADGALLGEGLGMLALRRLEDAERDGHRIYAVIRGIGASSDGRSKSVYAPRAAGQAEALRRAYEAAGYSPETVELVEAHGTATRAGDAAEFEGLRTVFNESGRRDRQWCALGSIKSQIGHTKAAAGVAGLIKAVLALHHEVLPPTIKVRQPNPQLHVEDSPFYLNTKARPWVGRSALRRAAVSSFGFGGSNFHVTLEEYAGPSVRVRQPRITAPAVSTNSPTTPRGGLAFLFPGQGSQSLDMGGTLAMEFPEAKSVWDRAAQLPLDPEATLADIVFPHPAMTDAERERQTERLRQPEWAQPALAAASLAWLAVLERLGVRADAFAGHSFGELTALCAAGAFSSEALLRMARRRGEAMSSASSVPGTMTAVFCKAERLQPLLAESQIVLANLNSPRQTVVSGAVAGIEAFERELASQRIGFKRLNVAGAFHSPLVAPATGPLRELLDQLEIVPPRVAVYSNVTGRRGPETPENLCDEIAQQLARPVRFEEMIRAMYADGIRTFVEVGPGNVLTKLVGDCLVGLPHSAVALEPPGQADAQQALAALAAAGVEFDREAFPALPSRPAAGRHCVPINGSNLGKPYPPAPGSAPLRPRESPVRAAATLPAPSVPSITPVPASRTDRVPESSESLPPPGPAHDTWLAAFQQLQQQMAATHQAYLQTTAETHQAFLRSLERVTHGLNGHATTDAVAETVARPPPFVAPVVNAPPSAAPAVNRMPAQPSMSPRPVPVPPPAPATVVIEAAPVSLAQTLLAVVADVTGYPPDSLQLGMEIEAELGIDSIKRVEIFSTLLDRVPGLPQVAASEVGQFRTLQDIVDLMSAGDAVSVPPAPALKSRANDPVTTAAAKNSPDLLTQMIAVVSEVTGYPAESLDLDMEIESDLGIDSIKRVEILSLLAERFPDLPRVETSEVGAIRTLRGMAELLSGGPTAIVAPAAVEKPEPVTGSARLVLELCDALPAGFGPAGLRECSLAVVARQAGLEGAVAEELTVALRQAGMDATVVDEITADFTAAVYLGGLREVSSEADAIAVNQEAFRCARVLARGGAPRLLVAVQDLGGGYGLENCPPASAWLGGLSGLVKTFGAEFPDAAVKCVDVAIDGQTPEQVAELLLAELLHGGGEIEVALRDGRRHALRTRPAPLPTVGAWPFRPDLVVVVTGGARGITATVVEELTRHCRPKLVLLGRTVLAPEPESTRSAPNEAALKEALLRHGQQTGEALKPVEIQRRAREILARREVRNTLQRLEGLGAAVQYRSVDARDGAALAEALQHIRQEWGPITGLIHAAGVLADKSIAAQTDAQFDEVFDTKVASLRNLLAELRDEPLEFLAVFSSAAARFGNAGQVAYAMGNEVLNKVAQAERQRRGDQCVVKSINWWPLEGGMVGPGLKSHFAAKGISLLPVKLGAELFWAELASRSPEVEVVLAPADATTLSPVRVLRAEILVASDRQAFLRSHCIKDVPVLPVVLVMEWFVRAARTTRPDLTLAGFHDFRVLKGVPLTDFGAGHRLQVVCREVSANGSVHLQLELLSPDGTRHYECQAEMVADRILPPLAPLPGLENANGWNWSADEAYDHLFHGPDFHVLRSLDEWGENGGTGTLSRDVESTWTGGPWQIGPALIDGGLQMALLWGLQQKGRSSLPTGMKGFRTFAALDEGQPLRCDLRARTVSQHQHTFDIHISTLAGQPVAELREVQMTLMPS